MAGPAPACSDACFRGDLTSCGRYPQQRVEGLDEAIAGCGRVDPPAGLTYVEFFQTQGASTVAQDTGLDVQLIPGTADGAAALTARVPVDYEPVVATLIAVPECHMAVLVAAGDLATRDALTATLHVVDTDEHGCPVVLPASQFMPTGNPDGGALVPGTPVSAAVCNYRDGLLRQQGEVKDLPDLLDALRTGVPGTSHADPAYVLCSQTPLDGELTRLRYADGTVRVLGSRPQECGQLYVSDGRRTVRMDERLATILLGVGVVGGYGVAPQLLS